MKGWFLEVSIRKLRMSDYEILFYEIAISSILGVLYGVKAANDGKEHPFL